jgi:hypothetical protein
MGIDGSDKVASHFFANGCFLAYEEVSMTKEMDKHEEASHVRVHIDRKPYDSPNPTNGQALYDLGKVYEHHILLYREMRGDQEDQPVLRDHERVCLEEDAHFYTAEDHKKGVRIIVNAREEIVYQHRMSYEQIVKLAYPTPPSPDVVGYLVTFYKGHEHQREGDLVAGQSVRICNGMVFNVTPNNRS